MPPAGIELNLPDLPEVPISLGPVGGAPAPGPRPSQPLLWRLREMLVAYLPLLLMVLLALGTWWLVKNSPQPLPPREAAAPRAEPDYLMTGFAVQRFTKDGRLKVRIEGRQMRHYPDVDRIEIDEVVLRAWAPDGRETRASARRALANGDGTEVQLIGGARVRSVAPSGEPVEIDSEFLHAFVDTERVRTHLPVRVRYGTSDVRAGSMAYDNLTQKLDLGPPMRAVMTPRGAKPRP